MKKATWAKLFGWGQLVVTTAIQVIQANGFPHTGSEWLKIAGSLLIALSVHHASSTSGAA